MKPFIRKILNRNGGTDETSGHFTLGKRGEELAVRFLKLQKYRIVVTNFMAPIGYSLRGRQLTGEIDIIAYDESSRPFILAFIEVKTRSSTEIAAPEAAVDIRKQRHLTKSAQVYRRLMNLTDEPYRYDVVSIVITRDGQSALNLLRGYFSEQRFRRSRWHLNQI